MNNLVEFLQELSVNGWQLWVEGERLRYRTSKGEADSALLAQIKNQKAEILEILQQQPDILNVYPLSYGQRALWFLWQLAPESTAYNLAYTSRIRSEVDVANLKQVFQILLQKHPVLRSNFPQRGQEPVQQINQSQEVDFQVIDAASWGEDELKSQVFAAYHCPFDLEKEPVMRVRLFTRSQQEHILLLVIHHIVCEAWSIGILLNELKDLYPLLKTGQKVSLAPAQYAYRDYVYWQLKMIESAEGEKLWHYWQQQLAGELPVLNLPSDRPRAPVQTYNGASHNFELPELLTQQLKKLAQSEGVTLYTLLLSVFQVFLHRYTGQDDIIVGSPTSGRSRAEFMSIIGYFVNPVVLRADLSGNPSFQQFLSQMRSTVLDALAHQDYPFSLLVERLHPQRDASYSPIFQASFILQNVRQSKELQDLHLSETGGVVNWGGLELEPFDIPQQEGQFDLTLEMTEYNSSLIAAFKYNKDLWKKETIERMVKHYHCLIEEIVAAPEKRIREIELLSQTEKQQILRDWNQSKPDITPRQNLLKQFEQIVEQHPNSPAVVYGDQQLTYQQLNNSSNQLAHHLQKIGIGAEVIVGVCLPRSVEIIIAIISILKAGGAYLPLDPNYPQQRLNFILEDAQPTVLLTQQSLATTLNTTKTQIICLDQNWTKITTENSSQNPKTDIQPHHLAYIIYTSGSTGTPKGVMVEHHSLLNLAAALNHSIYNQTSPQPLRISINGSLAFDTSVKQLLQLLNGHTLDIIPETVRRDAAALQSHLESHQIDVFDCTPSQLEMLRLSGWLASQHLPQIVLLGGETISSTTWQQLQQVPKCRFFNLYGPTECTVDATIWEISTADDTPILGRPLANVEIYILDQHLQPVPIGVPGELCIGGAGVARGYLHQPQLTTTKFISHPYKPQPRERLYRTGDIAKYHSDGSIEYIGRIDQQVKIRGFRIELGEIEAVLAAHSSVQQVVVVIREDQPGVKRLVAYIVPAGVAPSSAQIRSDLKQQLPEYMLPNVVFLECLPLSANGKVDRQALPTPDWNHRDGEPGFVPPTTDTEIVLGQIWAEVLGVEQVSIEDNFFALGGDSILTIQIVARANQAGLQLTPKQLFQHQTIAELALVAGTTAQVIVPQGIVTGIIPLTPIQARFFEQHSQTPHHYNQAVLLTVSSQVQPQLLQQALEALLVHHDALRLRFTPTAEGWQQENLAVDEVPLQVRDLSAMPAVTQQKVLEQEAAECQKSLNITEGPLWRVVLFDFGVAGSQRLLIVIHHLAVDGVSWRILLADLAQAYSQLQQGQQVKLPPKTTSFQSWAMQLQEYARSTVLESECDYWLGVGSAQVAALPMDYPQGVGENWQGTTAQVVVSLSQERTKQLLQQVPPAYNTQINDLLLSALVQCFVPWTGARVLRVDLEGHGREDLFAGVDLSRTVGWLTTVFPVVLALPGDEQPGNVLMAVKEQLRQVPQRGIGYGLLRYLGADLSEGRRLADLPPVEVCFNYLGQFDSLSEVQSGLVWSLGQESVGAGREPSGCRAYLLEVNGRVIGGRLQLEWTYSECLHCRSTVELLAAGFIEALEALIDHCLSADAGGFTPSDFPLANLTQATLNRLFNRKTVADVYPLSPVQQGMLFHALFSSSQGVYFEQFHFSLQGNLNVPAFQQAWRLVLARHCVLRTSFFWQGLEQPLQVVSQQVDLPWYQEDWRAVLVPQQQQRLSSFLQADIALGFDLHHPPLMRCALFHLADSSFHFVWSFHHILMDGWCLPVIMQEVLTSYKSLNQGLVPVLAASRPYRDYIAWLQKQDLTQSEAFWRSQLQGFQAPTTLNVTKTSHQKLKQEQHYNEQHLQLSSVLTEGLKYLAQRHCLTMYTFLQGAWALLLSRYSGELDVLFGAAVSGRPPTLVGIEKIVGLFINSLPARVQVPVDAPLLSWLEQLQAQQVEREQFAYTGLVDIQGWSEVPRGLPLFESLLVFENYPLDSALLETEQANGLKFGNLQFFERTNYPLTLIVTPGLEMSVRVSYDTDYFEDTTISRMLGHLQTILAEMVAHPQARLPEISMITARERQQVLVDWNNTQREYSTELCLHQAFEVQVQQTPNSIAVVFENQQLTYAELNAHANQLAYHLQSLGVGADVLVGICVERSLEMPIAILAILKSGGAYVPLDPAYPPERLAFMLEDTNAPIVVTQQRWRSLFPEQGEMVILDEQWPVISQNPSTNLENTVNPDNLLYVIYTSGSTGRPKGITLSHRALGNLIWWHLETMERGGGVLQFASLSFDASFHEMFAAWCGGGTLYMIPENLRQDIEKLVNFLGNNPIQKVILPVALWQQIAEVYGQQIHLFQNLTEVVTTGEQLQVTQPIIDLFKKLNHCSLHNHYGPSETHVVTSFTFNNQPDTWLVYPPIGKPIANTQIYILDRQFQPVPIGVPGFLLIGGANLAEGYLKQPKLTAQKFIPNPFGQGNLYQTGDLARYLPDGNIEFLGRADDQVKIRGFRIELSEVEAVLNKHPQLSQAVVTVKGSTASEKMLVAYVVPMQKETIAVEQLRQFLQQKLPAYMIPAAFVILDSLPLTPNKKVDRQALPDPNLAQSYLLNYVPPQTQTQEAIANIFASVLDLSQVGIHDNFFAIGGHSLQATRIISRLRESFQMEIPVRTLFEFPTVAELDRAISEFGQSAMGVIAPPIEPVTRNGNPLPLSWSQERLWFLDQLAESNVTNNMPSAVQITGNLNIGVLEQAVTEVVRRHEILRTAFPIVNNAPIQAIAPSTLVNIPIVDLRSLPQPDQSQKVQSLIDGEMQRPFNLASSPLMRLQLLQLSEQSHVLLVTMHHAVYDAWSAGLFIREISNFYQAYLCQESSTLPDLPVQYADFAVWQRQWLQGEVLKRQLDYWQEKLGGELPILQFTSDYPQPLTPNYRGAQQVLQLPQFLTAGLKTLSQQEGVTLFMTLLAAFKVLLSRHTGQEDIIVGTPIAGRNHLGTEKLIGFFINTLPLRTHLSDNLSFRELLTQVREVTLGAYTHQDIPFVKLVEKLQPERLLNRHPVFDVMFNFINTPEITLEVPGLTFQPLSLQESESRFLMTLYVQEQAEELKIRLVYRQSLFLRERMAAFLEQFQLLLEQIVAKPELSIPSYSLVTPQSRVLLPDPSVPLPEPTYEPVTTRLINWSTKIPQQTAICQDSQVWTYQELATSAQSIAQMLLSSGLQKGEVVALCGCRSFGLIASMIGILLGGGVLLTVDVNLPLQRQRLMLEQAQAKYLLVVADQIPEGIVAEDSLQMMLINPDTAMGNGSATNDPAKVELPEITPDDRAYIFFTSGSTGVPKGVLGTHKGIAHFVSWQQQTFNIGTGDRIAQLINLSFDAILRDVFLPLTSGATLCLPGAKDDLGADRLLLWMEKEKISLLHTVPTVVQAWLTQVPQEITLHSLRWIFLSGEPLTATLVEQWRQAFPAAGNIVNLYGSTETTMVKCFYLVPEDILPGVQPAGWALPDTQALVLKSTNELCGIGEIGEIVIRTPFRTLGYINAPQEQQQRFVANFFQSDRQDLLYYTGDYGRYRPDGVLEVLGRTDNQIKIRGIRVQPGEIEMVVNQYPAIRECVVVMREDTPGNQRLVAYVVANPQQTLDVDELRYSLKQHLPEFLIPSAFMVLESIPVTPTGKVDRRALPNPLQETSQQTIKIKPQTPTEESIVSIFAEVLKVAEVGTNENFFELGGHSLLAILVVSRLRETLKVEFPIRVLFETSTPAGLAVIIDNIQATDAPVMEMATITKVSREKRRVQVTSSEELTLPESLKEELHN